MRTKEDMHELVKNIHILRSIHASDALRQRIAASLKDLPKTQNGRYLPLVFVQAGMVAFSILLFVVLGSGVVAADQLSQKGHPFYGVRQTIEKLSVPFVQRKVTPIPTSVPASALTSKPTVTQTPDKSHAQSGHKATGIGEAINRAVKGVFDFRGNHQSKKQGLQNKDANHLEHKWNK